MITPISISKPIVLSRSLSAPNLRRGAGGGVQSGIFGTVSARYKRGNVSSFSSSNGIVLLTCRYP